ncbi:MAG: hypothetical protein R6V36_08630 [Psychroflexus sp.]
MSWREVTKELIGGIPAWVSISWTVFVFIFLVGIAVSTCSCGVLKDDNEIEEFIEQKIKDRTGVDVDFSGDSSECSKMKNSASFNVVKF